MPVIINGTTGVAGVDGSASTPAVQGTDTNTGMFFPTADTIAFAEGGTEVMRINSSGNVGIGTSSPAAKLNVETNSSSTTIGGSTSVIAVSNSNGSSFNLTAGLELYGSGTVSGANKNAGIYGLYESYTAGGNKGALVFATNGGSSNVTERMRIDSSGNLLFNSGYGSVATAYGCRAWVNFNGTGTVAIRASGNVTSITDNGTGDYTVNFTNAMPDANYVATFGPVTRAGADSNCMIRYSNGMGTYTLTTTTYRFGTAEIASSFVGQDAVSVLVAFHR